MKATYCLFVITLLFLFGSCGEEEHNLVSNDSSNDITVIRNEVVDTIFYLKNIDDSIRICATRAIDECKGTVILLPGWNYTFDHWKDSCNFLETANNKGFNVIMPDVKKTIYTFQIYPETRADWKKEVTRDWLNSAFLPKLQSLFKLNRQPLFVAGVSTGGRGALFLAMENQELFAAGAALSGDFDQGDFPNDNLYKGFFGSMNDFPERYKGIENPLTQLIGLDIPFLFGHAKDDTVVPVEHTYRVQEYLTTYKPENKCQFVISDRGGHQYAYWDNELIRVLDFFDAQ